MRSVFSFAAVCSADCRSICIPLPSIEILMSRKAKEVSEIAQVYLRAGSKELASVIN